MIEKRGIVNASAGCLGFVVVLGVMCGCGGSAESNCESICAVTSKCATATIDCPTSCKAAIQEAADAGCSSQASDAYSCESGLSSDELCGKTKSTDVSCAQTVVNYHQCLVSACQTDPTKCATGTTGTTGGGTTSSTGTGG